MANQKLWSKNIGSAETQKFSFNFEQYCSEKCVGII